MSDGNPVHHKIAFETIGPMQLGNFFNAILLGVVLLQVGQYFTTYRDPPIVRYLVLLLVFLDVGQTCQMMYLTWQYSVAHFGDYDYASASIWALSSIPFWSAPITWIVQGFYAWRIWTLTKIKVWPFLIGLCTLASGLAGIGAGIGSFMVNTTADNVKLQKIALVWWSFGLACDVLIMGCMFWALTRLKTGIKETDSIITKINRIVLETGMAATITVIIDCSFLFSFPGTDVHLIPVMMVGKVYSNSFMYLLNSRVRFRTVTFGANTIGGLAKSFDREVRDGDVEAGPRRRRSKIAEMKFTPYEDITPTASAATTHGDPASLSTSNPSTVPIEQIMKPDDASDSEASRSRANSIKVEVLTTHNIELSQMPSPRERVVPPNVELPVVES